MDAGQVLGAIDPKIYGHFIENLGRCIYGGVWQDGGVRTDVEALARDLEPPVLRWPGGAYSDCYHWTDGIGPRSSRPAKPNCYPGWALLRFTPEDTNEFGTDEYMSYIGDLGAAPYVNVNLGSGTAEEAAAWVAYCNADPESTVPIGVDAIGRDWGSAGDWARERGANGHAAPYGVGIWGVGNEIYGGHEIGGPLSATVYSDRFLEFAGKMRAVDPSARLVAVGSDDAWNAVVLARIGEQMNYLSLHAYYPGPPSIVHDDEDDARSLLAAPLALEETLAQADATITRTLGSASGVKIALDEWNLWWSVPQLDAWEFTLRDGLFAALVFHVLYRRSSRVAMANVAQMVNVLGLINTNPTDVYVTPLYEAFLLYRESAGSLRVASIVEGEGDESGRLGDIPARDRVAFLDGAATRDPDGGRLVLTVVNRHLTEAIRARVDLAGFRPTGPLLVREMNGRDINARNRFGDKSAVAIRATERSDLSNHFVYLFPPHSATALIWSGTTP